MENKKLFEQYYSRLRTEGILKALVCGVIVGFAVNFIISLVTWVASFDELWLWISIGACVLAIAVSTPIFYIKLFRPTTKMIARRIDRLGLEERMITMTELEKDESYIALRQREDAQAKLATVNAKNIKFKLSRATLIIAAVVAMFGISMTTVSALVVKGVMEPLPPIDDWPIWGGDEDPEETLFEVIYIAEEGGHIEGEAEQVVVRGESASTVVAVADDGWMFAGWDDELEDPSRTEVDVQQDMTFTAHFERVEQGGQQQQPGDGDGDGDGGEPGDSEGQSPDPGQLGGGAGGKFEDHNQIIDGNTYYRDVYEQYYEQAMEKLANGEDLTPEERAIIEAYFGIIE